MKKNQSSFLIILVLCLTGAAATLADPLGTAFTYQGRLTDSGGPATGLYDFQFVLCDAATNGVALGTNTVAAAPVTNGLYTIALDFGASAFDGNARWLALSVRTNGGSAWTALTPRLGLTPTPYAIRATTAGGVSGVIPDAQLSANIARLNGTNVFSGPVTAQSFSGSGAGLSGVAPAAGSSNYVARTGDTMSGTLNLPANGLVAGGSQLVLSGGNVGIGTTNPQRTLTVNGVVESTVGRFGELTSGTNFGDLTAYYNNGYGNGIDGAGVLQAVRIGVGYTPIIMNPQGGNVGIGTGNPTAKLHVVDPAGANVLIGGGISTVTDRLTLFDSEYGIQRPSNQATLQFDSAARFVWAVAGTEKMRMDNSGNFGIGTANPAERLEVTGRILASNPTNPGRGLFLQCGAYPSDYSWLIAGSQNVNSGLEFTPSTAVGGATFATPVVTMMAGGNVGIGTTAPQNKLDVAGSLHMVNDTYASRMGIYNPTISSNSANYYLALELDARDYNIPAGLTDSGYRIGLGVEGYAVGSGFQGTLGQQFGIWARHGSYSSAGTINNSYGVYIDTLTSGSTTFGNLYGLYQNSSAAKNYFAGNVGIGTVDPGDFGLRVAGNARFGGSMTIGHSGHHYDEIGYNVGFTATNDVYTYVASDSAASIRLGANDVGSIEFRTAPVGSSGSSLVLSNRMIIQPGGNVGIGTTSPSARLEVAGSLKVTGTGNSITTPVLSITGGADVAEPFEVSTADVKPGAVVVIDAAHPGTLKLSDKAYDTRVAGVVSGAGGIHPGLTLSQQGAAEGTHHVALTGRVYALADATKGPIEPGDLLTTSALPGHAMKVTNHAQAQGAILGKAMTGLDKGCGLVLVLVTLQ